MPASEEIVVHVGPVAYVSWRRRLRLLEPSTHEPGRCTSTKALVPLTYCHPVHGMFPGICGFLLASHFLGSEIWLKEGLF